MTWSVGAGLEGKGVVVAGAAGGIGREVVAAFATAGAQVAAVDVDQAAVDAVIAGARGRPASRDRHGPPQDRRASSR